VVVLYSPISTSTRSRKFAALSCSVSCNCLYNLLGEQVADPHWLMAARSLAEVSATSEGAAGSAIVLPQITVFIMWESAISGRLTKDGCSSPLMPSEKCHLETMGEGRGLDGSIQAAVDVVP